MSFAGSFSPLSYPDQLRLRGQKEVFELALSKQAQSLIANQAQLSDYGLSVVRESGNNIVLALEHQSSQLAGAIADLDWTFRCGFNEVLSRLDRLDHTLSRLVTLAETPSQTWAGEQYRIATDALALGDSHYALACITRALNGHGAQPGYRLDHRYHFLLGLVRLGDRRNCEADIVDPRLAYVAFRESARYASSQAQIAASLLAAGWSAYCASDLKSADEATSQSIENDSSIAESHFQLGKIRAAAGSAMEAMRCLSRAIALDIRYVLKATGDEDYLRNETALHNLISQETRNRREIALSELKRCKERLAKLHSIAIPSSAMDALTQMCYESDLSFNTGTLVGFSAAKDRLQGFDQGFSIAVSEARNKCRAQRDRLRSKDAEAVKTTSERYRRRITAFWNYALGMVNIGAASYAIWELRKSWVNFDGSTAGRIRDLAATSLTLLILLVPLVWLIRFVIKFFRRVMTEGPYAIEPSFTGELKEIDAIEARIDSLDRP